MWPCCPFDAHYFLLLDSCLGCRDCHIPGVFTCVTKSNYRPDTWRPRTFCTENRVTLRLVGGFWGNISLNSGVLTCDLPVNVCITSARRHSAATQVPRLRQLVPHASNCFPLDAAAGELQHLPSRLPRRLILEDCSSSPTRDALLLHRAACCVRRSHLRGCGGCCTWFLELLWKHNFMQAACHTWCPSQRQQGRCTKETSRGCLATLRLFLDTKVLRPAQKIGEKASCKEIRVYQCRNKDLLSRAETY